MTRANMPSLPGPALAVLALLPPVLAQAPLHERSAELYHAGKELESWRVLQEGLLAAVAAGELGEARAAAMAELEAALLEERVRELEAWPECLAALEAALPWPAATPPGVVLRLERLRARALLAAGRPDEARAASEALGYVEDFRVVGPFDNERGSGFAVAYPPDAGVDLEASYRGKEREVRWRANPAAGDPLMRVRLHQLLRPREQAVAYLATALVIEEERDLVLALGSTCALRVFLDGKELLARDVERPQAPDQDRVVLPLRAGTNQLLVKLAVEEGPWSAELRLAELDGTPARGVTVDSARAGAAEAAEAAEEEPRASAARPWPSPPEVLAGLVDDAEAARALSLWHAVVHPDDRVAKSDGAAARRALELDPYSVFGWTLLAAALEPEAKSRAEMAIAPQLDALQRLLELEPRHVTALVELAQVARVLNPTPDRAEELTARLLALAPDSWRAASERLAHLEARGREVEARELRERMAASPAGRMRAVASLWRAQRLRIAGKPQEATAELERAHARAQHDDFLGGQLLLERVDTGEHATAVELAEALLATDPSAVSWMLDVSQLFEHAGWIPEARGLAERAHELAPERKDVLERLERLDLRAGEPSAALAHVEELLRLDPGDDLARRRRALLSTVEEERFEEPWRRDARELVGTPLPPADDNDAFEVLERTTVWRVHPGGSESRYEHLVLRPLNLAGIQALDRYPIVYGSGGRLQVHNVRVIKPDGRVERAPAPRGGDYVQGELAARFFDLPPLEAGDLVDIEYRVDETEPDVFGRYFGTRHAFYPDRVDPTAPTRRSELVILAPPEVPLHTAVRRGEVLEHSDTLREDGTRVLSWVARDLPRPEPQGAMPRREELVPLVDVSTYASWDELARWWWSFIQKEFVTSPEMRAKVAELCEGLESERERIEAIARFVAQEIRYNAWAFGTHGYEPYSASTIFERRFGDCKDKSILLRQMLAEIGVEAIPVLIEAQYARAEEPLELAMVEHFNHCIAYVTPTEERPGFYLDATADRNPIDYLRADDQGATVLHVSEEGGSLHEIPYAPASENVLARSWDVDLEPDGDARVHLVDESTGSFGVAVRTRYGGEQGDLEKLLAQELGPRFGDVAFDGVTTSELDDLRLPARLEARFRARELWTEERGHKSVPLSFEDLGLQRLALERPEERLYDLVLDRPMTVRSRVRYELPEGARLSTRPPDLEREAPGLARYELRVLEGAGAVEVLRTIEILAPRVPRERYGEFKALVEEVRRVEERRLAIDPGDQGEER